MYQLQIKNYPRHHVVEPNSVPATNKRHRPVAIAESEPAQPPTLIEQTDDVYENN